MIRELDDWSAVAFAATLIQRMVPNFAYYAQHCLPADEQAKAQNALGLIWEWLSSPKSKINFALQIEKLEEVTPELNDDLPLIGYAAMDTCMALIAVMNKISAVDPQGAVVVAKLAQGGVEAMLLASEFNDLPDDEGLTAAKMHPLMEFEIAFQQELLNYLLQGVKHNKETCQVLRQMAQETGISTLGFDL